MVRDLVKVRVRVRSLVTVRVSFEFQPSQAAVSPMYARSCVKCSHYSRLFTLRKACRKLTLGVSEGQGLRQALLTFHWLWNQNLSNRWKTYTFTRAVKPMGFYFVKIKCHLYKKWAKVLMRQLLTQNHSDRRLFHTLWVGKRSNKWPFILRTSLCFWMRCHFNRVLKDSP